MKVSKLNGYANFARWKYGRIRRGISRSVASAVGGVKAEVDFRTRTRGCDVLLGSYVGALGGVGLHMESLKAHCALNVQSCPSLPWVRQSLMGKSAQLRAFRHAYDQRLSRTAKVFHSHPDAWFIQACQGMHQRGYPWVHTYHTLYFESEWPGGLSPMQREMNDLLLGTASGADVRISVSRWLSELLADVHGIETRYIPNGIRTALVDRGDPDRFTRRYGLRDFILYSGNIGGVKNPAEFVRLASRMPRVTCVMVGRGLSARSLWERHGVEIPKNLLVLGYLGHAEMMDALAACRVLVSTSHSEGLPTLLMEAMARECPIVASDTTGSREVLAGGHGRLYRVGDLDALVDHTRASLEVARPSGARDVILKNYDWDTIAPQLDKLYGELIHGTR